MHPQATILCGIRGGLRCLRGASEEEMNISISGGTSVTVDTVAAGTSAREHILSKVDIADGREDVDDPFYVCDLGRLIDLYGHWTAAMSGIQPFYAVKCNDDPALLKTLASLGAGFDCASKNEMKSVLDLGVPADRIIYANTCKQVSHLKFAARKGVRLMTFDNEMELYKVKTHFPTARLVLRIRAGVPAVISRAGELGAICPLGQKFGCSVSVGRDLLNTASQLGLSVVGISFHVGTQCQTSSAYTVAMEMAAELFRHAEDIGYHMTLLDIGGGFPGDQRSNELFAEVAGAVKRIIATFFSGISDLRIIAEPGRFFACSTYAAALNIIGKRVTMDATSDLSGKSVMYYVNDGVHGTLKYFYEYYQTLTAVKIPHTSAQPHPSCVWGATCNRRDIVCGQTMMAELDVGDWLFSDNMGAYTVSVASSFNGFIQPKTYYYVTGENSVKLSQLHSSYDSRGKSLLTVEDSSIKATPPASDVAMETIPMAQVTNGMHPF